MSESNPTATNIRPRGKPSGEGRFLWLSSLAVERIANQLGQTQAAYGIAIYVALCRISSREKNNPQITATVSQIAGMARLGYRKTFEVLHQLADAAKVIHIATSDSPAGAGRQPPNTYTLLASRLHNRKSPRLHNRKSPDCTGRKPSRAEIPKDTFSEGEKVRGEQKERDAASHGALALGAQAPANASDSANLDFITWNP
jgi:hypothetical protein